MSKKSQPTDPLVDQQEPQTGKVENDHNKMGNQAPTQKNEGKRTPASRKDRGSQIGSQNQHQSRTGRAGGGQKS